MSFFLRIHCNAKPGTPLGHSWIEYGPVDGHSTTYGTWGNGDSEANTGLVEGMELHVYVATHSRSALIDDEQSERLLAVIERHRAAGPAAWSLGKPCSAFAAEAWQAATGEQLTHRIAGISNPNTLASSIVAANQADCIGSTAAETISKKPPQAGSKGKTLPGSVKRKRKPPQKP